MKKFKKIFIAALLALTVAALPVSALAAEVDEGTYDLADAVDVAAENEGDVTAENGQEATPENGENGTPEKSDEAAENEEAAPSEKGEEAAAENSDASPENDDVAPPAENTFEELYTLCMSHLSEILSLAAFVGSLVCAILYKSGMLPLIKQGLTALSKTVHSIKESAELGESSRKTDYDGLKMKLEGLEETISALGENLTLYAERLESKTALENRQKRMEALTEAEVEMLYEIFMTSALPEYEKARIGEKIAKMKEVINTYEGE